MLMVTRVSRSLLTSRDSHIHPRAAKAVARLEDAGTQEEAGKELERYVGDELDPGEATQIQPFVDALVRALKEDVAANQVAHARVGLDIEARGKRPQAARRRHL